MVMPLHLPPLKRLGTKLELHRGNFITRQYDDEEQITLAKPGGADASDQDPPDGESGDEPRQSEGEGEQSENDEEDDPPVGQTNKRVAPKVSPLLA